ncbi:PR-1-like protein [Periconia macrospinosa]|uniref:PR-1-like protein n=1 Tax=Periconia macrospinosa TaxID=97972 RepID=A0A2V1DJU0_9PLEO|nr:PR-1-like protein [Periconia macrospinosa]
MRSSIVLASALAAGALAGPVEKRKVVTETRVHVEIVTVYVTAGQPLPTASADASIKSNSDKYEPVPASSAAPEPAYTPIAPSSSSSSSLVPVYTPIVVPSAAPTTSAVPTTSAAPTTTVVPTTSSQAPAPPPASSSSAPAPAAPQYGVNHVSGKSQATLTSGVNYQDAALWHHNRARANHGASNLEWSTECESAAMTAAQFCDFEHHTVDGQGQNLFTLSGTAANVTAGITESWYKAEADIYHWWGGEPPSDSKGTLNAELFEKYGHLTEMLWKETTHVGCVTIDCGSKMTIAGVSSDLNKYTVCNYAPAGNVVGSFGKNVAAPIGSYDSFSWAD